VWHLTFLTFRNPLDVWWREPVPESERHPAWGRYKLDKLDQYTSLYGNLLGAQQGWRMFGAALAHETNFPAVRIELADGTATTVYAESEPDLPHYLRVGGYRQRKLEAYLASWTAEEDARGKQMLLWANYARHAHRRYLAEAPHDTRRVARLVVVRRHLEYLPPGANQYEPVRESELVAFTLEGRLLP
jgi:hypothetical protein